MGHNQVYSLQGLDGSLGHKLTGWPITQYPKTKARLGFVVAVRVLFCFVFGKAVWVQMYASIYRGQRSHRKPSTLNFETESLISPRLNRLSWLARKL